MTTVVWSDDLKQTIIQDYQENQKSILQLARDYDVSHHKIRYLFERLGIEVIGNKVHSRRYKYNEHFFDVINTEEKAYWLGFIYADGYVTKRENTYQLGISLGIEDREHLIKWTKSLDSDLKVHDYIQKTAYRENTEYSRVLVSNNQICQQLMNKGCVRGKTDILTFPSSDIVPTHLINHFIRGYFDGDGCLTGSKHSVRDVYVYQVKIVGTKEMLTDIHHHLPLSNELHLRRRHENDTNNYTLEVGGKLQVARILEYLYHNSTIYLDRKYDKYIEFQTKS